MEALRLHELLVQTCDDCGRLRWPARALCNRCGGLDWSWLQSAGTGRVASWMVSRHVFDASRPVPYTVVLARLDEQDDILIPGGYDGPADGSRLAIDRPVRAVFEIFPGTAGPCCAGGSTRARADPPGTSSRAYTRGPSTGPGLKRIAGTRFRRRNWRVAARRLRLIEKRHLIEAWKQLIEHRSQLEPRQAVAETEMVSISAERHVRVRIPTDVEIEGTLEDRLVPVGRAVHEQESAALGQLDAAEHGGPGGGPHHVLDRRHPRSISSTAPFTRDGSSINACRCSGCSRS